MQIGIIKHSLSKMNREDEWTVVNRQRSQFLDRRWNHKGVTTMFVSNIPDGVSKDTLRKIFIKYGELTDVYMAVKKDSRRKNFAFVRYRKVSKERELEATLQKIMCSGALLEVNIAKFERKMMAENVEGLKKKPQFVQIPLRQAYRDNRSFMEAMTGKFYQPPPPPPPL